MSSFSKDSLHSLGRQFGLLFSAGLLSDIGAFTTHTALTLHIYKLTDHNTRFMGLAAMSTLLPLALFAPFGGVLAEKRNRKWVMIANDMIRIPLVLCMMLTSDVWLILGLNAMICGSTALFNPSRQAIIPELVSGEQIHLANTINGGVMSLVHILGPVMGAFIYANTGSMRAIVYLNGVTYVLSLGLLMAIQYKPARNEAADSRSMLGNIVEGFRYVHREKDLLTIFSVLLTAGTAIGMLVPLLRPFADEILHGNDKTYGLMIGCFGAGGLFGPLVGYAVGRRLGLGRTILTAFLVESILLIVWSRVSWVPLSCLTIFLWGMNIFTMIPCYMSYVHTYADKDYMGRTFSLFDQAAFMPQILGAGVIALVGSRLPTQNLLTGTGIFYVMVVLIASQTSGARLLRSRRGEPKPTEPEIEATAQRLAEFTQSPEL